MMNRLAWVLLVAACVVLTSPGDAFAWGPVTHIGLGNSLLGGLGAVPMAIAALLKRNRTAYLYGTIAADFVFAKRLSRVKQACHHWSTAFQLLDAANEESDQAFAHGYLSHLAADTVAHGKYVPHQIAVSGTSINFGHLYWELRADAAEPDAMKALLEEVLAQDHARHHDALAHHIKNTFLSFDLNRVLFDRMNSLAVHRGFRRTVHMWGHCSRWYLSAELLAGYRAESIDRMISVLSEGRRSPVLREDPNGTSALMHLRVRKREVRRLRRRGLPMAGRLREASRSLAPQERAAPGTEPASRPRPVS